MYFYESEFSDYFLGIRSNMVLFSLTSVCTEVTQRTYRTAASSLK